MPDVAVQSHAHCRQQSMPGTEASRAWFHGPLSTRTSTASIPLCCAQATPATATRPAVSGAEPVGTSMRDSVFIGACCDQPRSDQYAVFPANVVTSISVTHLVADTYPYSPGTTMRTGKPCSTGSAWPFMATASRASRPSMTVCTGVPDVNPSLEVHSSWSAPALMPAWRKTAARLAPSHSAFPMYGPATGLDTQHSVM